MTDLFAASFEWFRERCALNKPLSENKDELRRKMDEAKLLGERAAQTKYAAPPTCPASARRRVLTLSVAGTRSAT